MIKNKNNCAVKAGIIRMCNDCPRLFDDCDGMEDKIEEEEDD